jgi:very-short-patch-repair endonuclease
VRLSGVLSHESAAARWRIELPRPDERPHVTVARHRRHLDAAPAVVHWANLAPSEVIDGVTSPLRTVLDLARGRPLATGLAAADSALRQQLVLPGDLANEAAAVRGPGARAARLVASCADARAESVLESALRAILIQARLTGFEVQLQIDADGFRARVDLGAPQRRIVIEADSFAHHGHRAALERDCRRYTELTIRGWRVLRFAWEHVMFEPDWVADCIRAACS